MMKHFYILYLFISISLHSQDWKQTQKVTPLIRHNSSFGFKIALHDNTLFSSAYTDSYDANDANYVSDAGSIYAFKYENNKWTEKQKIVAGDRLSTNQFGRCIAADGDRLFISSRNRYGSQYGVGAVYVFRKDAEQNWKQEQKISPATLTANGFFGNKIAANHSVLAIASSYYNTKVYEFNTALQTWEFKQDLLFPSNLNSYGTEVSAYSDKIFVGRGSQPANGITNVGQVNVYKKNTSTNQWEIIQTIDPPTAQSNLYFGSEVLAKDGYLFISAVSGPSQFYIYQHNQLTDVYELKQTFTNGATYFGSSISMDQETLVVSAPGASNNASDYGGAAYIYKLNNSNWELAQKIYNSDSHPYDRFGDGIAVENNTVVVGAPDHDFDINGTQVMTSAGAVYTFNDASLLTTASTKGKNKVAIFPNPFINSLSITSKKKYPHARVEVFDMSGKTVFTRKYSDFENETIDLQFLSTGTYQIRIISDSETFETIKVIKR